MIRELHELDQNISLIINSIHCQTSDLFMQFMSDRFVWAPLYLLVLIFLYKRLGWRRATVFFISAILVVVLCDQIANLFKYSVARLRPCYNTSMLDGSRGGLVLHMLEYRGSWYGFFSGHASNAFGFATITIAGFSCDKKHKYMFYNSFIVLWATILSL